MKTARYLHIFVLGLFFCGALYAAGYRYTLKVSSANPPILVDQNNVPFLIVGDSPHSLFSNLSSAEAVAYLADRAARGVNLAVFQYGPKQNPQMLGKLERA